MPAYLCNAGRRRRREHGESVRILDYNRKLRVFHPAASMFPLKSREGEPELD